MNEAVFSPSRTALQRSFSSQPLGLFGPFVRSGYRIGTVDGELFGVVTGDYLLGFGVEPPEGYEPTDVTCQATGHSNNTTHEVPGGTLCGSRTGGVFVTGIRIAVTGMLAKRYDILYRVKFASGAVSPTCYSGEWCRSKIGDDPVIYIRAGLATRPEVTLRRNQIAVLR